MCKEPPDAVEAYTIRPAVKVPMRADRGKEGSLVMTHRILRSTLAIAAMVLGMLTPSATAADSPHSAVTGTVTDSSGAVLVGASVSAVLPGGATREATTDPRGRYRLELPVGTYGVTAYRQGFSPITQEVVVTEAAPATHNFTLAPAGFAEEVTVAFTAPHASTALRFDAPVQDIPLSVKSYGNSFMKAIETRQVADMYSYMTGVSRSGNTAFDFSIRGLSGGVGNLQYNGLPAVVARMGSPPTTNIERIEVLKGPASVLYGQAQPGGIVNIVTKRPQAERANTIDLRSGTFFGGPASFGNDLSYRAAVDFTGPIDKNRKFLYRLVASRDTTDSFRDFVEGTSDYIVPSLTWNVSEGTILTLEFEYRHDDVRFDHGLAAPRNDITLVAPHNVRYQEPEDFLDETGKGASLLFTKAFNSGLLWSATFRSVFHDDRRKAFESVSVNNNANLNLITVTRRDRDQINKREYQFLDTNFKKTLQTGSVGHTLLVGINGGYEMSDFNRAQFAAPGLPINLYHPAYGQPGSRPTPTTWQKTDFFNTGIYIQDHVAISPRWKALAALRYDRQDTKFFDRRTNQTLPNKDSDGILPMGGLVFQPVPSVALYGSYSTSYTPAAPTALDAQGRNSFDPERGRQWEGGVKLDFWRSRANVTAAYFNIEKDNVLNTVAGVTEAFGQIRSKGLEVDVRFQPIPNLQMIGGYAFADSIIAKDKVVLNVGARTLNIPRHTFNLWTRYDRVQGALHGLGLGLGVVANGRKVGSLPLATVPAGFNPILYLPPWQRVDAAVYYVLKRYELTFKVTNLFDERYYESASIGVHNIFPGSPREGTLSVRLRF
jgi:iron complex outermembrane receptor protein